MSGWDVHFSDRSGGDMRGEAASAALCELLGLQRLSFVRQVHGVRVLRDPRADDEADGQVTSAPGVGLAVRVADCLPIALAVPGSVAILHAGWRGLAGGIVAAGVAALDADPATIEAVAGPCAGPCCYEIGREVQDAFGVAGDTLDLRAVAHDRLADAGVERVRDAGGCTICDGRYFSHRGGDAGRQVGVVWLR